MESFLSKQIIFFQVLEARTAVYGRERAIVEEGDKIMKRAIVEDIPALPTSQVYRKIQNAC